MRGCRSRIQRSVEIVRGLSLGGGLLLCVWLRLGRRLGSVRKLGFLVPLGWLGVLILRGRCGLRRSFCRRFGNRLSVAAGLGRGQSLAYGGGALARCARIRRRAHGDGNVLGSLAIQRGQRPAGHGMALQAVQPGGEGTVRALRTGKQQARGQQLKVQARGGCAGHVGQRLIGDIGPAGQLAGSGQPGLQVQGFELVGGNSAQDLLQALRHRLGDHQVAEALQQVLDEATRIKSGLDDAVDRAEQSGPV